MKIINFLILSVAVLLCSCENRDPKSAEILPETPTAVKMITDTNMISTAADTTLSAQNSVEWKGTYKGTLPCADCAGIETEIMLHEGNTYMISTRHLDKNKSSSIMGHGDFKWVNGSVIKLENVKEGPSEFLVEVDRLVQLDMAGKKMNGTDSVKYVLTKN